MMVAKTVSVPIVDHALHVDDEVAADLLATTEPTAT